MGAVVFTLDAQGVGSDGNRRVVIGKYHLSTTYASGGDTFDPSDIGLEILDEIVLGPARDPGSETVIICDCTATAPLAATRFTTGSPAGKITGYAVPAEISSGDQSAFVGRFVAFGS
jgi:hypothetical protein